MDKNNIKDPGQKAHDIATGVSVLDSTGTPIRDLEAVRKEAVENLVALMRSSVDEHVSGTTFNAKFNLAYEPVHSTAAYAQSLKEAVAAILEAHPGMGDADGSDADLQYVIEICDTVIMGTERVKEHLDAARIFSQDLDNINMEFQTQIQRLF